MGIYYLICKMDQISEIKQKIDVVDLISSYLTLKKAGRNYRACCPFHKEKTPSFMVSPEKQIWYCFGCNQGGDIFTFVEKIEGMDFSGAIKVLADKAGVILERTDFAKKGEKDKYLEITALAAKFFSHILNKTKVGEEAKRYLVQKRKLKEETIERFSLGYAPDSQTSLGDFLFKKGYKEADLVKIGLLAKNYQGKIVDKFRGRAIFPITDTSGKTIGFVGRIFREEKNPKFTPPKYLNSPQSDIYDKSSVVYGLYQAREAIREKDLVIIVEGNIDVLSSHQAGVKNVVASSGTALTIEQVKILSRYTHNIAFAFDQDEAGKLATKRAMDMTRLEDINVKAVVISQGKDPDELIQIDQKLWEKASANPVPIVEFYYNGVLNKYKKEKSSEDKKDIAKEVLPVIAEISDDIEKAHWIKKISEDLSTDEKYIIDAIKKVKTSTSTDKKELSTEKEVKIDVSREMLLLGAIILYPQKAKDMFSRLGEDDFSEQQAKNLYKILFKWYGKKSPVKAISFEEAKKEMGLQEESKLDIIYFLIEEFFSTLEEKDALSDVDKLINLVVDKKKQAKKEQLEKEIGLADKTKDKEKIKKLLRELQDLI